MAYIFPNSDIAILHRVPIDSTYQHTGLFDSEADQVQAFGNYVKYTLSAQSYQRVNKNKIRVAYLADDLFDCNYMFFKNTSYGNKYFFAFIDSIDYVNDNCCEINYTIDVIQSWWFDWGFPECFVEREHTIDDTIGSNTVPENFELGEKVENLTYEYRSLRYLACVITTKRLTKSTATYIQGTDYLPLKGNANDEYQLHAQGNSVNSVSGLPNGCFMYLGIPVSADDVTNYWSSNRGQYDMQDYRVFYTNNTVDTSTTATNPLTLGALLDSVEGYADLSLDDIVGIYIYPADLSKFVYMLNAQNNYGYFYGTAVYDNVINATRPTRFVDPRDGSYYTPKNNKLYTYPYIDLKVSNNQGSERTYQFERFDTTLGFMFSWVGIISNSSMTLYPRGYNYSGNSINEGLSVSTQFQVPLKSNAFDSWLEQQKYSAGMGLLGGAIHSALGIGGGIATGNPMMALSGAASVVSSALGMAGNLMDMQNVPDQISGDVLNGNLNVATKRVGFRCVTRTIKAEYARIIDNYFTMFGYATNRVKTPNVRTAHRRQYWNYIKTKGAIIKPYPGRGLPADDAKKIAQIFDNGITFWSVLANVGDYWQNNPII